MTRGTMHSSLEQMNGLDVAYEDGAWIAGGRRPRRAFVTFPGAIGRRLVARYPTGEVITVPRHVATRELVARISTASIAPAAVGPLVPSLTPLLGRLLRSPLRSLLDRAIDTLPEGPAEDARRAVRWTIIVGATGEDGRSAQGIVTGPDIYGLTAKTITQAAIELADPAFTGSGALAPAQAVDPAAFLDGLADGRRALAGRRMTARGTAVVTGGAHGLGAEIARLLVARGHHVVVADRDGDGAQATAAAIGATRGHAGRRRPGGLPRAGRRHPRPRRLDQQRRHPRHRPELGDRRGHPPAAVRRQRPRGDQRHQRGAGGVPPRRARRDRQRRVAGGHRARAARDDLRRDQARGARLLGRHPAGPDRPPRARDPHLRAMP